MNLDERLRQAAAARAARLAEQINPNLDDWLADLEQRRAAAAEDEAAILEVAEQHLEAALESLHELEPSTSSTGATGDAVAAGAVGQPAVGTVARLREQLTHERAEIRKYLDTLGARSGSEDPDLNEGFADAGQATAERSSLLSLVRSLRDTLREVEQALARMDAGTYGLCERCGRPIDEERLDALPAARLCLNCKRQRGGR